jgi:Predicted transcriptional regulator
MKVGDEMLKGNLLDSLLEEKKGILKTSDAIRAGVSKAYFLNYVKSVNLEKVTHGIYVAPDTWLDEMYLLQLRLGSAIFSHESSLYLLNLAEREPLQFTITVRTGYNNAKLKEEGIKMYFIKPDLFDIGLIEVKSPTGHILRAYNAERTICDLIRSRSNVEIQDLIAAMKAYTRQGETNIPLLMRYAKIFRVEKILRQYLEVLI